MNNNEEEQMKRVFAFLVLVCSLVLCCSCASTPRGFSTTTEEDTTEAVADEDIFIGAISNIDLKQNIIAFVDVHTDEEHVLRYHGGVDLTNKYGDIVAISQIDVGEIMDVTYNVSQAKLTKMQVNSQAMRYENVQNPEINTYKKMILAAGETMTYTDGVVIVDDGKLLDMNQLCSQDELTLRVLDGKLCSVTVELGHGYVKLIDYNTYIGGMIEIGYDVIVPVTDEMLLTVREGDYQLRITKGHHTGTRYVTVTKNMETIVSLASLQIEPQKTGEAVIKVLPENAEPLIYIDGAKLENGNSVELVYGKHSIIIAAEGYDTYSSYFTVEHAYKIYEFDLEGPDSTTTEEDTTETDGSTEEGSTQDSSTEEGTTEASTEEGSTEETTESTTEEKKDNTVTITAPVGVKLYVDGKYVGETPCHFKKTPGSHVITLTRTGCMTVSYTITLKDDGKNETFQFEELKILGDFSDILD